MGPLSQQPREVRLSDSSHQREASAMTARALIDCNWIRSRARRQTVRARWPFATACVWSFPGSAYSSSRARISSQLLPCRSFARSRCNLSSSVSRAVRHDDDDLSTVRPFGCPPFGPRIGLSLSTSPRRQLMPVDSRLVQDMLPNCDAVYQVGRTLASVRPISGFSSV